MSLPPINPDKTLSGIALDPQTLERVIPESRRADGSVRKQLKVRPGFTPQEDVRRFRGSRQAQMDANALPKGHIIGWAPPSSATQPAKPLSKSAKKNAKRKEKREEQRNQAVLDNWEDDEDEDEPAQKTEPSKKNPPSSNPSDNPPTKGTPTSGVTVAANSSASPSPASSTPSTPASSTPPRRRPAGGASILAKELAKISLNNTKR